jgi:hypothetical protein
MGWTQRGCVGRGRGHRNQRGRPPSGRSQSAGAGVGAPSITDRYSSTIRSVR